MIALYLAFYGVMLVFGLTSFGLASALGAQVSGVNLGWPRLVSIGRVRVGLLPMVASTELRGRAGDEGNWFQLGLVRRLFITLAPFGAYAIVAVLCLGPGRAAASVSHGFAQLFVSADTTSLMRAFLAWLRDSSLGAVFGVVFAKCLVMNTVTAIGNILMELRVRGGKVAGLLTMLVGLWVACRLLWGLGRALLT